MRPDYEDTEWRKFNRDDWRKASPNEPDDWAFFPGDEWRIPWWIAIIGGALALAVPAFMLALCIAG